MLRRLPLALIPLTAVCAWGQNAISARSGMVNHVEGTVLLDGKTVEPKFGEFPQVKDDQTLSTEEGRAEVLLTPGAFLRLAEGSSFKMLSNKLSDTALEIVSGSAMIEVDELLKDNAVAVHFKGGTVSILKAGLYRFDADLSRFRVYEGEASATLAGRTVAAKKGKQIVFGDALVASNFDTKVTDPFYRWASRRAEYISAANVSAAHTASSNGFVSNYGTWAFNPWFGMFTYLPGIGYGYSPFGWGFYSPYTVGYAYVPYLYGGGGGGTPVLSRVPRPAGTSSRTNAATFTSARASALTANAATDNSASAVSPRGGGIASSGGGGIASGGGNAGGGARGGMSGGGARGR
ncbi:MAG: hypothetical protein JO307_30010 [Bryobacterales bacterium]|nr:hypothetical protein [Bryobacterales bacterium]MBV9397107.1 hypothetical protein [Bryobacterales bacterium]